MLNWLKRRVGSVPEPAETPVAAPRSQQPSVAGKYVLLYRYLANRYADNVVLTFSQIEDLLGFALPDLARLRQDWWTNVSPTPAPPDHSDAWRLANRTATPNMTAQTVAFERVP